MAGPLLLVGGAEDRTHQRLILQQIAGHASGGRIVLIPIASRMPRRYIAAYRAAFADLHAGDLALVDARTRADCDGDAALEAIENARAVYFTGGQQDRLINLLRGTRLEQAVRARWAEGAMIAGTSAGATAIGGTMTEPSRPPQRPGYRFAAALGLLPGTLIDQHFTQRRRHGRLIHAILWRWDLIGLGIDENTAARVTGDDIQVIGRGTVTRIAASRPGKRLRPGATLPRQPPGAGVAQVQIYATGAIFSLRDGRVRTEGSQPGHQLAI